VRRRVLAADRRSSGTDRDTIQANLKKTAKGDRATLISAPATAGFGVLEAQPD
jgi:hypothetical protein